MAVASASKTQLNLKNAVAAHLRRCMKLEMALPFHRLMRLAPGLHLRFCSTHFARRQVAENSIIIQENSQNPVSTVFSRLKHEERNKPRQSMEWAHRLDHSRGARRKAAALALTPANSWILRIQRR
jgi:hypothetical protein